MTTAALESSVRDTLDGKGRASPLGLLAPVALLGTLFDEILSRVAGAEADISALEVVAGDPAVDGIALPRVARASFDPSANPAQRPIGTYSLGVTLPDDAIIVRSWYRVVTTFTSATDAATLAIGVPVDGAGMIKAAIAISNVANPYDAGNQEGVQTGAAANFGTQLTAARALSITTAVEALTAGRLILYVEYVIGAA